MMPDKQPAHQARHATLWAVVMLLMAAQIGWAARVAPPISDGRDPLERRLATLSQTPPAPATDSFPSDEMGSLPIPLLFFESRIEGAGKVAVTMLLIALATLISEDLACIGAGLMAAKLLYDAGVFAIWANNDTSVVQFLPPLILTDKEVDELIDLVRKAFA